MKVAAFGRTHLLYESIKAVAARGHEVVLIGTCPASPEYTVTEKDFATIANSIGCPYFCNSNINRPEYIEMVKESGAEVAISVNWITLIGQKMRNQFKYGIINAHAGDLPRFRGNACPNWAILAGEKQVVLTLHEMVTELDAGAILLQNKFPLTPDTYIADVYRFLYENVPKMFVEVLDGLNFGTIVAKKQPSNPDISLRCFPRLPRDSEINWNLPAEKIAKLVRSSGEPFAGAYSYIDTEKVIIWRAYAEKLPYPYLGIPGQVVEIRYQTGEVAVLTQDGVLILREIEMEAGNRIRPSDIIKSTRTRFGIDISGEISLLKKLITNLQEQITQLSSKIPDVE